MGYNITRVGKNPGFFEKTQPTRVFSGFIGFFRVFSGFFGFFQVFSVFFRNIGVSSHLIDLKFYRQQHTSFLFRIQPLWPPPLPHRGGKGKKLKKGETVGRYLVVKVLRKKCFLKEEEVGVEGGGCEIYIPVFSAARLCLGWKTKRLESIYLLFRKEYKVIPNKSKYTLELEWICIIGDTGQAPCHWKKVKSP